jgi:hypothetical protein
MTVTNPYDTKNLHYPTVIEVIGYLSTLPPETRFRINDPDTGWTITNIHIDYDDLKNIVWFGGDYAEMSSIGEDE